MLKLEHICKTYRTTEVETAALDDVTLNVDPGEFLAMMGPSGCGKSTLLNILGLIDSPTAGAYWFLGEDISRCSEEELTVHRRGGVGFVFQSFNLIDDLNVVENVEVALLYLGVRSADRRRRANDALDRVDLAHRARHMPKQLSGGQQQRVAVARALVSEPKLILADEPTGNLDSANGEAVMDLLSGVNKSGTTVVMVTHSEEHARRAHRVMHMLDGRFVSAAEA
ncbi:MAG TPA: ABC transporter ATP-binding protein [Steroidobacteraceae bacterium]|jgi:putative ABC transport system ATP-binding protein|nr:ABC transporter ATP-binding protein [Steroidobacteraceae bacterium]